MNAVLRVSIRRWAVVLLLVAAGCKGSGPPAKPDGVAVGGKVLLPNGEALTGGALVLRPMDGLHGATAPIQQDGSFELVDPTGKKAVVPGKYQVFLRFNADQKALAAKVSPKYKNSEDSDSDVVVDVQAARDLIIRLNR